MTIEPRDRARHSIDIEVQIQYRKRRFFSARARGLTDQGMYLEVRSLTLPTGTMIVLEIQEVGREWRIPAVVLHQDQRGIGVMFRELQPELIQSLMPIAHEPIPTSALETFAEPRQWGA